MIGGIKTQKKVVTIFGSWSFGRHNEFKMAAILDSKNLKKPFFTNMVM